MINFCLHFFHGGYIEKQNCFVARALEKAKHTKQDKKSEDFLHREKNYYNRIENGTFQLRSERLHGAETKKKFPVESFFSFRVVTVNERVSVKASWRECYGNYDRSEVVELWKKRNIRSKTRSRKTSCTERKIIIIE